MTVVFHKPKWFIIAAIAILAIVGVGVVTFFTGSKEKPAEKTGKDYVELNLATVKGASSVPRQVVFLPWGGGPADASRKGLKAKRSTIEAVFSSGGRVFVVDHPEGVTGARVRWFSDKGALLGSRLAPPGSSIFRPFPGGYDYVIAKSGGRSETAVICNVDRGVETTFTIPLQVNSGGLIFHDNTLYASVTPSDVDHEKQIIYSREMLIPVAIDAVQVDDATADANAIDVWGFGMDDKAYSYQVQVLGLEVTTSEVVTVVGSGERKIRIPRKYRLIGVSPDSQVYLAPMPPEPDPAKRPVQLSAVWASAEEPFLDVLVATMDGKITSSIVLPYSRTVARYDMTMPLSLSEDGLYSLREEKGGVAVVFHPFK